MNVIKKSPVHTLGYNFVASRFLPKGKDEYYLRNQQNKIGSSYRQLTAYEIEVLVRNRNTSDNWNNLLVSDAFTPELVQNCKFFGLVRIGRLEPYYLEFHNLRRPVGLYSSTIISADLGNNVVIDNCNYLSHYIIGNDCMIVNVNELAATDYARFGNGTVKDGEEEANRIWLEVCNENGGRSIIPFDGMLPGDAWLWTRHREDKQLQDAFKQFTDDRLDSRRGYYGEIGDRTVIKNCRIIKDVWTGTDCYLKGANKLKNLTINSTAEAKSQVGEGCELVNGIINEGCRIFYGVKAVRFFMASHSQLKYGARLINSFLGNNATISCCEVLNSLIFPAHEQHHNNSFLCAALVMGQSNIAAGATIGSNHNSRSPDGEIIAGRGFWPGLCVSLKHNSLFASFCILAKGDYPAELNIRFPFALVSNDVSHDQLVIMPAYWFMYNMYALARNAWKYIDRDKRIDRTQLINYDFLAPDTIYEITGAIEALQQYVGNAYILKMQQRMAPAEAKKAGRVLLESGSKLIGDLEVVAEGVEHSDRRALLVKVQQAYDIYKELVAYHAVTCLIAAAERHQVKDYAGLQKLLPASREVAVWVNAGGQLVPAKMLDKLLVQIREGKIKGWDRIHQFYEQQGKRYDDQNLFHAIAALQHVYGVTLKNNRSLLKQLLQQTIFTREWMVKGIHDSRAKDYTNPFRKMVYENRAEMDTVTGRLESNSFILQEQQRLKAYKDAVQDFISSFRL